MNQQIIDLLEEFRIKKSEDILNKLHLVLPGNLFDPLKAKFDLYKTKGAGYSDLFTYISELINKYRQPSDLPLKEKTLL
jgi:hypothetical protein